MVLFSFFSWDFLANFRNVSIKEFSGKGLVIHPLQLLQTIISLASLAAKKKYWFKTRKKRAECTKNQQVCFLFVLLRSYSPTLRRFLLCTKAFCPWWKSCCSLTLMLTMKSGAASYTLWVASVRTSVLHAFSSASWTSKPVKLHHADAVSSKPRSTNTLEKAPHVVNLSLRITHDETLHMCDMLDVALKYSSLSLYSKSLFFDAQPGGSPACKKFQSVVNLTILLDRAASVSVMARYFWQKQERLSNGTDNTVRFLMRWFHVKET